MPRESSGLSARRRGQRVAGENGQTGHAGGLTGGRRRRRRRWRVRWLLAGLGLGLGVGTLAMPGLASVLAPGLIERQVAATIAGRVSVTRLVLSWFRPPQIGLILHDVDGAEVAAVTLSGTRSLAGLLGIAAGWSAPDVGQWHLTGDVELRREPDGTWNLARALARRGERRRSGTPPAEAPVRVPAGLTGALVADGLRVRGSFGREGIEAITDRARVEVAGSGLRIELAAQVRDTRALDAAAGQVVLLAAVHGAIGPDGSLALERARLEVEAEVRGVPLAGLDALASAGGRLTEALGPVADARLRAAGSVAEGGEVAIESVTPAASLDVRARAGPACEVLDGEATLEADSDRVLALVPGVHQVLQDGTHMQISRSPRVRVALADVRLPRAALAGDLRGAGAQVTLQATEVGGMVRLPDGRLESLELRGLRAQVDARDLGQGMTVQAEASARVGDQSAGRLDGRIEVGQVLDEQGRVRMPWPGLVRGEVALRDAATAMVQPLVEAYGLDLPAGIGPRVDAAIRAEALAGDGPGAGTDLVIQVRASQARADAAVRLEGRSVRTVGDGVRVVLHSPGTLVRSAVGRTGATLDGTGWASLMVRTGRATWAGGRWDVSAQFEAAVGGLTLTLPSESEDGDPVGSRASVGIRQVLADGEWSGDAVRGRLRASGEHEGATFGLTGEVEAQSFGGLVRGGTGVETLPAVRAEIQRLPPALVGALLAWAGVPAEWARLAEAAPGSPLTVSVRLERAAAVPVNGHEHEVAATLRSQRVRAQVAGLANGSRWRLVQGEAEVVITPALLDQAWQLARADAGTDATGTLTLAGPARLTLRLAPFDVPATGFWPDLAALDVSARVSLAEPATVRNLRPPVGAGRSHDVGPIVLREAALDVSAPVSALRRSSGDGGAGQVRALATAAVGLPDGAVLLTIEARGQASLAGGRLVGESAADLALRVRDLARLDAMLGLDGLAWSAAGESAALDLQATVRWSDEGPALAWEQAGLDVRLESPRVTMPQPARVEVGPQRLALLAPVQLGWRVEPGLVQRLAQANAVEVRSPLDVNVDVFRLALPGGADGAWLKPGVFALDAQARVPQASVRAGQAEATVRDVRMRVMSGAEAGVLGFSVRVGEVVAVGRDGAGGGTPGPEPAMELGGAVREVSDAAGRITLASARWTATGRLNGFPTALADVLTHQGGLLVEALGERIVARVAARGVSMNLTGGQIEIDAQSDRARVHVAGTIREGVFVASGPIEATLTQVTPELGARLVRGLPAVGRFEKRLGDEPASLRAEGLHVPLDGRMERLSGVLMFDPGVVRFETSEMFAAVLKAVGQKAGGMAGRRLDPLQVTARDGVLTYARYRIPLGEFTFQTRGTVDLVNRRLDVITYVPLGALSEEVAGVFRRGLGRALGRTVPGLEADTLVPLRTRGSFEHAQTAPDVELFMQEAGASILRPERLGPMLEEWFRGMGGGRRKNGGS